MAPLTEHVAKGRQEVNEKNYPFILFKEILTNEACLTQWTKKCKGH